MMGGPSLVTSLFFKFKQQFHGLQALPRLSRFWRAFSALWRRSSLVMRHGLLPLPVCLLAPPGCTGNNMQNILIIKQFFCSISFASIYKVFLNIRAFPVFPSIFKCFIEKADSCLT